MEKEGYKEKVFSFIYEYGVIIAGVMVLWITFYFIAPLLHELAHIAVLKALGCKYLARMDVVILKSFMGKIYESCTLTARNQFVVYISGVSFTLMLGLVLAGMDIVLTRKNRIDPAIFTIFFSMGFLLNTATYLIQGVGDVRYAFEVMGLFEYMDFVRILALGAIALMFIILLISLHHDAEVEIKRREKLLEKYHHEV